MDINKIKDALDTVTMYARLNTETLKEKKSLEHNYKIVAEFLELLRAVE